MPVTEVGMPGGRAGLGMKRMIPIRTCSIGTSTWRWWMEMWVNGSKGCPALDIRIQELSVRECTDYPGECIEWAERRSMVEPTETLVFKDEQRKRNLERKP